MRTNEYDEAMDRNGYVRSCFSETCCYYANDRLTACYGTDLVRHEVFHSDMSGGVRELSKRYGAWVTLCPAHHGHVHNYPQMHKNLQREAQRAVMERYDWTEDDFRNHFGKNYL